MTQLLPLNEAEAIFAPFHDPSFSREIGYALEPSAAVNFNVRICWDNVVVKWDACLAGEVAGALELPLSLPWGEYDELVFCLTLPTAVSVRFLTKVAGGTWQALGKVVKGATSRHEIVRPVPQDGAEALRVEFIANDATAQEVKLAWFGLRNSKLAENTARDKVRWSPEWLGLIKPESEWGALEFRRGLLFSHDQLDDLRAKKNLPHWREHFARLEAAAREAMKRNPEDDLFISDYAPFPDERYVRESERGRAPFYYDALRLALVGLINDDQAMTRHALRYLMSMLHLRHWSPSAETRVIGSTWDQRCFTEEMMTTSVALLMDWLDSALTDRARDLGFTMLWDRGLAVIERDMAKFEYVHHINQGPWFCRARIFAGLLLEKEWPRFETGYVERAVAHLREGMDRYLQPDGGMDEGPMYLGLTLETVVPPLMAYANSRGLDVRELFPAAMPKVPDYLATVAQTKPGLHVPDSDCASEHPNFDTYPILAEIFPGSIYGVLAAASLLSDRPYTYSQHYVGSGIFSFLLGPMDLTEPGCVAATFSLLSSTGLAASYRQSGGHSLRLVFAGCKARPSHSHFDKGGFHAEVDGEAAFVDRGMIRYDDPRSSLLKRTENHNTLAPSFDGVFTIEQTLPEVPLIPDAMGDETNFRASLDLAPVWKGSMRSCHRTITSASVEGWGIEDDGELEKEGRVVFFLQSRFPFVGAVGSWTSGKIDIEAPWAERGDTAEHLIDSEFRSIYRLRLWSSELTTFSLVTRLRRKPEIHTDSSDQAHQPI